MVYTHDSLDIGSLGIQTMLQRLGDATGIHFLDIRNPTDWEQAEFKLPGIKGYLRSFLIEK